MTSYYLAAIFILSGINIFLRYFPFMFPKRVTNHPRMKQLSAFLPPAIMLSLVLYCLSSELQKQMNILPFLLASAAVYILHTWKNNVLLSIGTGTICYCVLIRMSLFQA